MAKTQTQYGPKCSICGEFLKADDRVVEVQRMYQSASSSWPSAVRGGIYDSHAHLHHFLAAPDPRESKG